MKSARQVRGDVRMRVTHIEQVRDALHKKVDVTVAEVGNVRPRRPVQARPRARHPQTGRWHCGTQARQPRGRETDLDVIYLPGRAMSVRTGGSSTTTLPSTQTE